MGVVRRRLGSGDGGRRESAVRERDGRLKVAIVGCPNVGKSVIFNRLTGAYATVSNYPGTTVDVSRGRASLRGVVVEVIDTPGMYSLLPITEEERVARRLLLDERPSAVLHVVDARNLDRMLPITLQLIEAGLPLILVLNMMDEAENAGVEIDQEELRGILGIPMVATVATSGKGMDSLSALVVGTIEGSRAGKQPAMIDSGIPPGDAETVRLIEGLLNGDYGLSRRSISLMLMQGDAEIIEIVRSTEDGVYGQIQALLQGGEGARGSKPAGAIEGELISASEDVSYRLAVHRQERARAIAGRAIKHNGPRAATGAAERLSRLCMEPGYGFFAVFGSLLAFDALIGPLLRLTTLSVLLERFYLRAMVPALERFAGVHLAGSALGELLVGRTGVLTFAGHLLVVVIPVLALALGGSAALFLPVAKISRGRITHGYGLTILFLVVYLGLYQFVGIFGAGSLVAFIESHLFEQHVNPAITALFQAIVPWQVLRDLFVGDYGILTLGVRYAVALILPIVGAFFVAFSILEDSGYFPRLALLVDGAFKKIGLSGRAVIPMVLGLGCDTMATMVTRILETRRERVISTLLLALAVPCSAQLGVILALLSGSPGAVLFWMGIVMGQLVLVGFLASMFLPGEPASFYMEIPPMRMPRLANVLSKTYSRMHWYLLEILPLFVLASVLIWVGTITGTFQLAIRGLTPVIRSLGLPDGAAVAFLFGFFRRDYGAAGLFDLQKAGALSPRQMVVSAVTLTLFLPCVAQFLVMKKERGLRMTLAISGFVTATALSTGWIVNQVLRHLQ